MAPQRGAGDPAPGAIHAVEPAPAVVPAPAPAGAPLALAPVDGAALERERQQIDADLRERRAEIARIEERLLTKEESLNVRLAELDRRQRSLDDRGRNLDNTAMQLKAAKQLQLRELERIAHLTSHQARQILLRELQDELRHDTARLIRQAEEETSATPIGGRAASSPPACSAWPAVTPWRRRCRWSTSSPTT